MGRIVDNIKTSGARVSAWATAHFDQRYFVIGLSLLVGVASGLAAVVLKHAIAFVKSLVYGFSAFDMNVLLLVSPAVGILISLLLVRYVVRDNLGHGITKILHAISKDGSSLKRHHVYSSIRWEPRPLSR